MKYSLFVTIAKGLESLLSEELTSMGLSGVKQANAGVSLSGTLEDAYRICLWSRLAGRVLLSLTSFTARTPEELYAGFQTLDWSEHLEPQGTLAINVNIYESPITHSQYAAQKAKDAIVDQFRDKFGIRPSVDTQTPDLRINLYLFKKQARVSLDLSGESLHRRHYRKEGTEAPLKENLAAAILWYANWPAIARQGGLLDPMCGSGTFLIEGAMIAGDIAPGLRRPYFGFLNWKHHQPEIWNKLVEEAHQRARDGLKLIPPIIGYDTSSDAIKACWSNIHNAELQRHIHVEKQDLSQLALPPALTKNTGLIVTNPPYGERIQSAEGLRFLYTRLGNMLQTGFPGWKSVILSGNPLLRETIGLRHDDLLPVQNGPLACEVLQYTIPMTMDAKESYSSSGLDMFTNRVKKNLKKLKKWRDQAGIQCFRAYDADLPEYAVCIDCYEDKIHVQEYAPPATVDAHKASMRLQGIVEVLPELFGVPPEHVFLKERKRQKGNQQYQKMSSHGASFKVRENNFRFQVNLVDYLDTGLFLDQRLTRQKLGELAKGKHFLNLFAYTGTATVYAAASGAASTTTVDMSQTYLDWAKENMLLNGQTGKKHQFIQADCLQWLEACHQKYGLIYLDPPTFSNSARMKTSLDIQRDHVLLIQQTMKSLSPEGLLIFCCNKHNFKLDRDGLTDYQIEDWTAQTIPQDFARTPRIHQCYKLTENRN
ncbi:MAG: bifunctional 23S rRNA (guanine(2069)-N(7))-methyltransferase RlmK/23S rRNA (guanine(2445)-N(2))-methyltransferase RlmL [SAR324 cluster bacterium]|nr:bifunctional 23S rRNA (guanine(2069)-N(7))-methyltransferase RlmK/23S rRNA (guanine(2445)-N(2))-methyltransferase RlmL [SAR324 cluster bacterium]